MTFIDLILPKKWLDPGVQKMSSRPIPPVSHAPLSLLAFIPSNKATNILASTQPSLMEDQPTEQRKEHSRSEQQAHGALWQGIG